MKRAMWHLDKLLHQQMCCFFPNVTVSSKEGAGPAPPVRLESRGSLNVQANPSGCKIICFVGVAGDCPQVCVNHSAAAERRVATRVARGGQTLWVLELFQLRAAHQTGWGRGSHHTLQPLQTNQGGL